MELFKSLFFGLTLLLQIQLQSSMVLNTIQPFDGIFVTEYQLELIQLFRFKLQNIYTAFKQEINGSSDQDHNQILSQYKNRLIQLAQRFFGQAVGGKKFVTAVVHEYCDNHNKQDSFLLHWMKVKDGHEYLYFDQNIQSFAQLDRFCIDLIEFLADLMYSCPIAHQRLQQLIEKWNRCKIIVEQLQHEAKISFDEATKTKFLGYLKEKHLARVAVEAINESLILSFVTSFYEHSS